MFREILSALELMCTGPRHVRTLGEVIPPGAEPGLVLFQSLHPMAENRRYSEQARES